MGARPRLRARDILDPLWLCPFALGCASDRGSVGVFGDGGTAAEAGSSVGEADGTGSGASHDATSAGSSAESATGPGDTADDVKFDTPGGGSAADDGGTMGCQKIDFLFVIDNSGSMGAHQTALINSFPAFIDTIFSTVQAQDYHIMVIDSDADGDIAGACEPCSPNSFWCDDWCTAKANLDIACETALGAGEVAPYNNEASNQICGLANDQRFLTSDLPPDEIKSKFACMGKVGTFGSGAEMPITALQHAVTTQANDCNQGFLREDAVLVVTIISDDYPVPGTADDARDGDPQAWYDAVAAVKNSPDHVVTLGIINTADAACVSGAGDPIVHPTEKFVEFVQLWGDHGLMGNICSPEYNAFFEQAVALIDTACDEFEPEG
jgi:hypothetical protein